MQENNKKEKPILDNLSGDSNLLTKEERVIAKLNSEYYYVANFYNYGVGEEGDNPLAFYGETISSLSDENTVIFKNMVSEIEDVFYRSDLDSDSKTKLVREKLKALIYFLDSNYK